MFTYTEKNQLVPASGRRDAYTERFVYIHAAGQRVGRIEIHTDLSGKITPIDAWHKETPINVEYIDPERSRERGYDDTYPIDYCRTVSEGKKIFADWYAENKSKFSAAASADAKRLPASPDAEFYPTPSTLAGQMAALVDWRHVQTILEPSAGKGDLIEFAAKCAANRAWKSQRSYWRPDEQFQRYDCIEIDPNLSHILTGKGFRVVHDDFLTFDSIKHYDISTAGRRTRPIR